ncbi:hypothetical protein LSCM4_05253 [Leishmania orientalis]|uniref:Uncharacterized protein n=1 Tax=Leishmania orientalis TaxID=2249476 RepID=A0A836KKG8_9TRYP|nr:hypothetical protein LSCM4_05253 [Leishmania orientalis]
MQRRPCVLLSGPTFSPSLRSWQRCQTPRQISCGPCSGRCAARLPWHCEEPLTTRPPRGRCEGWPKCSCVRSTVLLQSSRPAYCLPRVPRRRALRGRWRRLREPCHLSTEEHVHVCMCALP